MHIAEEKLITLKAAAKLLPGRRPGHAPHYSTLIRWSTRGVKGARLEVVKVGGTLCTSEDALRRFFDRCTHPQIPLAPTAPERRSAAAKAGAALEARGV